MTVAEKHWQSQHGQYRQEATSVQNRITHQRQFLQNLGPEDTETVQRAYMYLARVTRTDAQ